MSFERKIQAAHGYMELELTDEALKELDTLSPEEQQEEITLQLRLLILMHAQRWEQGVPVCELLRRQSPGLSIGYIHGAYCLHVMGKTEEAREILRKGPPSLYHEATYFYNLGCYNAILGDKQEAVQNLQTSFQMNPTFRDEAQNDPDLESISELLK
ncbi:MAG: hypothetical protein ABIP97_04165 [Chthoniobacterales bacterium]